LERLPKGSQGLALALLGQVKADHSSSSLYRNEHTPDRLRWVGGYQWVVVLWEVRISRRRVQQEQWLTLALEGGVRVVQCLAEAFKKIGEHFRAIL
jgi:hypothetical protein